MTAMIIRSSLFNPTAILGALLFGDIVGRQSWDETWDICIFKVWQTLPNAPLLELQRQAAERVKEAKAQAPDGSSESTEQQQRNRLQWDASHLAAPRDGNDQRQQQTPSPGQVVTVTDDGTESDPQDFGNSSSDGAMDGGAVDGGGGGGE